MSAKKWWISRRTTLKNVGVSISSFASFVGLGFSFLPPVASWQWWVFALVCIGILGFVAALVLDLRSERGRSYFLFDDTVGIREYMHKWIEHGGRVAIWTRDLSWANDGATIDLLRRKAKQSELILCLPESNALAKELQDSGAEVCVYGRDVLDAPASRFTIRHFGRDGSAVAVGRARGDVHTIEEFDSASHPAFYLAQDLVNAVRKNSGSGIKK